MDPSPQKLMQHLKKNYPNAHYHSTYEVGFCHFWAHRALCKLGINNIVVNPADVPTTHKEKTQKRDKRDGRKLARELADGSLEAIYIPTQPQESLRLLARLLVQLAKRNRQLQSKI